ncbi:PAS domain-containing sensor histidine kinase [Phyllobacterium phragmitis]|uniref:histidine kinase n=1 Tax=Phyllobacterium phragmitis TaxID=2670329 RepID=A0A2S9IZ34_9HYPH|nr:ATP-binding protein [Phyllobacterium phragmitis]PRD45787.1 PAS domain-containing sensor histidine kinase [Phyllobacterium phragmitis]
MHAILLKTFESAGVRVRGCASMFDGYCRRLVPAGQAADKAQDRAADKRMIAAFCAMPVALVAAFAASGTISRGLEAGLATAIFVGVAMILCALSSLSIRPRLVGIAGIAAYGAGISLAGFGAAPANPALWAMAAAIPFEAWLVGRTGRSAAIGMGVGILVFAALIMEASPFAPQASLAVTTLVTICYVGSLLARAMGVVRLNENDVHPANADDIENAIDGVVIRLSPDGVINSLSVRAPEHFGVSRQVLTGTQFIDRVHVSDRVHYLGLLADLRAPENGQKHTASIELRLRRVGRDLGIHSVVFRPFRLEAVAIRENGVLRGFTMLARDISGEQASREALQRAEEAAESLQISKSRFLASVSHELRTPLNSIIGFSDVLLHELMCRFENEKQREYVDLIHQSGTHLLQVVNGILEVSKIESGTYQISPEAFAFSEAVGMCNGVMSHQAAKKGVVLCDRLNASVGEVIADRRAVRQILINLVSNAVKFTEKGGCVTIDAGVEKVKDARMLVFSVADTGIGMAAGDLTRLCQPFTQLDNAYTRAHEGTGLGLSLVKGLVELHEGTMEITSRPGEGTIVTVCLPVDGPRTASKLASTQEQKEKPGTVVDIHRIQAERRHEKHKDEQEGDDYAQNRKTA